MTPTVLTVTEPRMTNQPILTVKDITARWKCSRRTVLEVIRNGELRAFRIGKRAYRARLVDVEAYEAKKAA